MRIFYHPEISHNDPSFLNVEESRHCVKVLRLKKGDEINVIDGTGNCYHCHIIDDNPRACKFVVNSKTQAKPQGYFIHIAIAPTKNQERLEWFVEKAVEFGVDKISLILCDQSERKMVKLERLNKKAIVAMKQSMNYKKPDIVELTTFKNFIATNNAKDKFIAHVDENNTTHLKDMAKPKSEYLVLIGPEGDFSQNEINLAKNNNYKGISLGQSRLRTETAGIAACHILNLINDE